MKISVLGVITLRLRELLFLRVTCVIKHQNEMKEHLKHEFGYKPPSLFNKGVMRKNTKNVLADALNCHSIVRASPKSMRWTVVIPYKVGHRSYIRSSMCYVSCVYVRHVLDNFGTEVIVILDGYREAMSIKVAEQQRRATQSTCPYIIFELDMTESFFWLIDATRL